MLKTKAKRKISHPFEKKLYPNEVILWLGQAQVKNWKDYLQPEERQGFDGTMGLILTMLLVPILLALFCGGVLKESFSSFLCVAAFLPAVLIGAISGENKIYYALTDQRILASSNFHSVDSPLSKIEWAVIERIDGFERVIFKAKNPHSFVAIGDVDSLIAALEHHAPEIEILDRRQ